MLAPLSLWGEPLRVASLHPVVSDLAREVGGEQVEVVNLMPLHSNPHLFYPSPETLKEASRADLILASGKNLETYLDEFMESVGGDIPLFEVGRAVPSLRIEANEVFICCPAHSSGAIDPHWWQSIRNVRRAAGALARELARLRPAHETYFEQRYHLYATRLDELYDWAKEQIATIPRADRELTTAHASFGYLCRELGLRSITVLGLTDEQDPDPAHLKEVIRTLREHRVRAVFPEMNANPEVLESLVRETGVAIGGDLHGDMPCDEHPDYVSMMRQNIMTIIQGLRGEP